MAHFSITTLPGYQRSCLADVPFARSFDTFRGRHFGAEGIAECLRNIATQAALRSTVGQFCRRDMEIHIMKTAFAALAFMLAAAAAACNTVEGVGEDVKAAGTAIDRTAEDASH